MSMYRVVFSNAIITFVSRILGFVRDVLMAQYIGAGWQMDAFLIVFKLPNLFRRLFADGVFSQSLLPAAVSAKNQTTFLSNMYGLLCWALLLVSLPFICFPKFMLSLVVVGLDDGQVLTFAVDMLPVVFPYLALVSCCGFYTVQLNMNKRFGLGFALPIVLNICLILGIWGVVTGVGDIRLLSYAVLLAGCIQLACSICAVSRLNGVVFPSYPRIDQDTFHMLKQASMAFASQVIMYFSSCLELVLASFMVSGSLSWLYYTDRLIYLPVGVISVTFANVLLPKLSIASQQNSYQTLYQDLQKASKVIILISVPCALGGYVYTQDIVSMLFRSDVFVEKDILATASSLKVMMLALPAIMLNRVWMMVSYATKQAHYQLKITGSCFIVSLVVSVLLMGNLGHVAISCGSFCGAWLQTVFLYRFISRQVSRSLVDVGFLVWVGLASISMLWALVSLNEVILIPGIASKLQIFWMLLSKTLLSLAVFSTVLYGLIKVSKTFK